MAKNKSNTTPLPATNGKDKPILRKGRDRQQIKEQVLNSDPTKDYHSTRFSYFGELFVQQLPMWRLWTGRMMLTSDPLVNFSLNIRNAAMMPAEIIVTAKNEQIKNWVTEQWNYLWNYHRPKLTNAKRWGYNALQVVWKIKDGLLCIKDCKEFAPEDARALEVDNKLCGQQVKGAKVFNPQALWLTFASENGGPYGVGCLRRSYPAWYEKWMDHGAKRLLQLRMIKDSYIGDVFWYPPNMKIKLPDGNEMSWRDLMREIGENRLSGGALTLPRLYDSSGKELTGYTPPQDVGAASQIFEWNNLCDEGILRGADIPMEVVKAADTGSGYSGRSIPFLVVLSVCTQELTEICSCVVNQVLRPVAWLNWGGDVEFELRPKSLVDSFSKDTQGSPMGGGALGGQPSGQPQYVQEPPPEQGNVQFGESAYHSTLTALGFEKHVDTNRVGNRRGITSRVADHHYKHPEHGYVSFHKNGWAHTGKDGLWIRNGKDNQDLKEHLESYSGETQHAEGLQFSPEEGALHAPKGGVTIHGVEYKGGEYIPKEVIAELAPEDKQKLRAGSIARHIKEQPDLAEPTSSDETALLQKAQSGNQAARAKVVDNHMNLVKYLANQYSRKREEFDDLVQVGSLGLLKAMDGFDTFKDVKFNTYAYTAISNALKTFRTKAGRLDSEEQIPVDDEGQQLDPTDIREESPEDITQSLERLSWLHKQIKTLPDRQQQIVRRHLLEGEDLENIANDLGVTKAAVWQQKERALASLKKQAEGVQFSESLLTFIQQLEEDSKHEYSCLMFKLPSELGLEVWQLGHRISHDDIVKREDDPHITVKYGLHTEDIEEVRKHVQCCAPVAVQLGKCSSFSNGEKDVVKIEVHSQALHDLNSHVNQLPHTDTYPDYKPHITIAYVKSGLGEHYAKRLNDLEGRVVVFDRLIFSNKSREHTPITLTAPAQFSEDTGMYHSLEEAVGHHGPVLAESHQDGYTMRIHDGNAKRFKNRQPLVKPAMINSKNRSFDGRGTKTIQHPSGHIVKAGKWMDWGETHYPKNYTKLPKEQRAQLEADEQLKYGHAKSYAHHRTYHEGGNPAVKVNQYDEVPNQIPGGLADDRKTLRGIDPEQLKMGVKVELEHTNDHKVAMEIALDHLTEDSEYYTKLKKVEQHSEKGAAPCAPFRGVEGVAFEEYHKAPYRVATHKEIQNVGEVAKNSGLGITDSTEEHVPIHNIVGTQAKLYPKRVKEYVNNPARKSDSVISANKHNGTYYLTEGHHRVAAAIHRGDKHVHMRVYNLDPKQFEESDAIKKLREFVLKGTNAKLVETVDNIRKLKLRSLDHLTLQHRIVQEIKNLQPKLTVDLASSMWAAQIKGITDTLVKVPQTISDEPATDLVKTPSIDNEPLIELPVLKDSIETLSKLPVATGINYHDTAEKVKAGAFVITADVTDKAVAKVRDLVTTALKEGTNKDEFIENVIGELETSHLAPHHIENIFRTNTAAALSSGQAKALASPMVVDHFPYAAYHSTTDGRVRKEHLALEKLGLNGTNIYRQDDPTFKKFRPPWDYQCRCSWAPQTVEQAARRGVQEAIQWLDRAKTIAEVKGGSFYQYLTITKPSQPEFVTPPSFNPSPEFERK